MEKTGNNIQKNEDESLNEFFASLDAEIEQFKKEKEECEKNLKDLMAKEDPQTGKTFASEIFKLQQEKLRLHFEIEFRRKKRNRVLWEKQDILG